MNVVREAQCWREAIFFLKKRESSELEKSIGVVRKRRKRVVKNSRLCLKELIVFRELI